MQKTYGQRLFDLLFWIAGLVAFVSAIFLLRQSQFAKKKKGGRRGFRFNVKTVALAKGKIAESVRLIGDVHPLRQVTIHSEVEGVVGRVRAREGQKVRRGASIVSIQRKDLSLQVQKQVALLKQAEAAQRRIHSTLKRDRDLWRRAQRLYRTQSVSQREWIDTRFKKEASVAALAESVAMVALRKVELKIARRNLYKALVRAPFGAYIKKLLVERGRMLRKGDSVAEIIASRGVEVRLYIPPSLLSQVRKGMKVRLRVIGSNPKQWFSSRVMRLSPAADATSRNRQAFIRLSDAPATFVPGLPVEAQVLVKEKSDALVLPKDALVRSGKDWVVYQVVKGKAIRQSVQVVAEDGSRIEVVGRLKPGAAVVHVGNEALFPFAPVRVIHGPGQMPRKRRSRGKRRGR